MNKKIKLVLSSLLLFSITGCTFNMNDFLSKGNQTNSKSNTSSISSYTSEIGNSSSTSNISSNTSSSSVVSSSSTTTSSSISSVVTSTSISSSFLSSNVSSISSNVSTSFITSNTSSSNDDDKNETKIIDIYATNDFHGRISENKNENEPGIAKLATYLKNRKQENQKGYIYLNSGDYWQDTYESGYNKGKLLTECLDLMECETMSLGNHEFDWGIDIIRENKKLTSYTTFLGANIRNYPNIEEQVDFAEPYKIIERDGLRIGIIGAIGQKQITSITSSNWQDITFLPHAPIVQELSDELRVKKDCDIVILSIHADESDSSGSEITKISPVSNKKYVDAVFCAHSHQREIKYYNSVPFVQAGDHGVNLSHIQLQYQDGEVISLSAKYEGYALMNNLMPDNEIQKAVDSYFDEEFIEQKNKVHGTINGVSTINSIYAGNILAKATYDLLQDYDIDCDIVINNGARDYVSAGEMTSEKIFNMIPFTNKTLVVNNIKGEDIINECVNYSNPYYVPDSSLVINKNEYYTVACIDYMMLHMNEYRKYNYFPSYNPSNLVYTINKYPNIIVEDYLSLHGTINALDYIGENYSCL